MTDGQAVQEKITISSTNRRDEAKQIMGFYFRQIFDEMGMALTMESRDNIETAIDYIIDEAVAIAIDETLAEVIAALKGAGAGQSE